MAITSEIDICNMALGHMGNQGTINDIDTPGNSKEITFALWYEPCRRTLIKHAMPNFALSRALTSRVVITPPFGYEFAFEKPANCLKVLGLGLIDEKNDFKYNAEGQYIYTDDEWEDGCQVRFVEDITDVNAWSPEFQMLMSWYLAGKTVMPITQDINKKKLIETLMPKELSGVSGLNAQENPPIRKSTSKFRQSRNASISRNAEKK